MERPAQTGSSAPHAEPHFLPLKSPRPDEFILASRPNESNKKTLEALVLRSNRTACFCSNASTGRVMVAGAFRWQWSNPP